MLEVCRYEIDWIWITELYNSVIWIESFVWKKETYYVIKKAFSYMNYLQKNTS